MDNLMRKRWVAALLAVTCMLTAESQAAGPPTGVVVTSTPTVNVTSSGSTTGASTVSSNTYANNTLGAEVTTQTCAGWTFTISSPGWTDCTGTTLTRTASASNLTATSAAVVSGTTYKIVWTVTLSAGSIALNLGGVSTPLRSISGTFTEIITTTSTSAITISVDSTFAGTINLASFSVKPVTTAVTQAITADGSLSAPALLLSGFWNRGGTATNNRPLALVEPTGTTSTAWNTSGTGFGINAPLGFSGNIVDFQRTAISIFSISSSGNTSMFGNAFVTGNVTIPNTGQFAFSSTSAPSATADAFVTRVAAGDLRLGAADALAPVNQTLRVQGSRSGIDSNVAGANLTISSGLGTGTATGSSLIFATPLAVGSGTGAQTQTTRMTIGPTGTTVKLGIGVGTGSLGGVICKGAPPSGATVSLIEEVLATCTIAADSLAVNGNMIRVFYTAKTAANANIKRIRIRIGGLAGTLVFDDAGRASNAESIMPIGYISFQRLSSTLVLGGGWQSYAPAAGGGAVANPSYQIPTAGASVTWASTQDLVITGTTATAIGDLTLQTYSVEIVQ